MSAIDSRSGDRRNESPTLEMVGRLIREADVRTVAVGAYSLSALIMLVLVVSALWGGAPARSTAPPSLPAEDEPASKRAKPVERTAAAETSGGASAETPRPSAAPTPPPAPELPPAGGTHTVSPGDTLSAIAGRYGTTIDEILRLNPGVDPYALKSGQQVRIP